MGRLGADKLSIPYDWIEGQAYAVQLHTTTGGTIATDIPIAVETPTTGIGSAYALGALALGAFLVIGFVLQNTTEGLAIVVPYAQRTVSASRLVGLGAIAGAPAIAGAWIGGSAYNGSVAALLLGAIVQVIQQLVPTIRDRLGRALYPASVSGIAAGMAILYLTGLLVGG